MIYGYKCTNCQQTYTSEQRMDRLPIDKCQTCAAPGPLHRDYSGIALHRPMMAHFNSTTQTEISSQRQFEDKLKAMSADASLYTGQEHRYEPIDITDTKSIGVTEEGLEFTNRDRVARGKKPIDLSLIK